MKYQVEHTQRESPYLHASMYYPLFIREVFVIKVLDMISDECGRSD